MTLSTDKTFTRRKRVERKRENGRERIVTFVVWMQFEVKIMCGINFFSSCRTLLYFDFLSISLTNWSLKISVNKERIRVVKHHLLRSQTTWKVAINNLYIKPTDGTSIHLLLRLILLLNIWVVLNKPKTEFKDKLRGKGLKIHRDVETYFPLRVLQD